MPEVKEALKTSNLHSSAYMDTVEGKLRRKAKTLAMQAFSAIGDYIANPITNTSKRHRNTPNRQIVFAGLGVL